MAPTRSSNGEPPSDPPAAPTGAAARTERSAKNTPPRRLESFGLGVIYLISLVRNIYQVQYIASILHFQRRAPDFFRKDVEPWRIVGLSSRKPGEKPDGSRQNGEGYIESVDAVPLPGGEVGHGAVGEEKKIFGAQ